MDNTPQEEPVADPAAQQAVMDNMLPPQAIEAPMGALDAVKPKPVDPAGSAFAALDSAPVPVNNRYSDTQTNMTATLATLAQAATGLTGNDLADQRFSTLTALNADAIRSGNEAILRTQIALKQKQITTDTINAMQGDLLKSIGLPEFHGIKLSTLVDMGAKHQNSPPDPNALEVAGVSHVQTMAASDPDQAALMDDLNKRGSLLAALRDNGIKIQLFNREFDALKKAKGDQGNLANFHDFLNSFVPSSFFDKRGNVTIGNASFWDWPSTTENKEATTLWNKPVDEFGAALPGVFKNFASQYFGVGTDLTKAVDTARQFSNRGLNQTDALTLNVGVGIDLASFIPVERAMSVASKAARMVGNRTASADIVANSLAAEIHGGTTELQGLQAPAHNIEESLPSSLVASTPSFINMDVKVSGDVADRLRAIREGVQSVLQNQIGVDRLAPNQVEEAVQRAIKEVQTRYRDAPVADLKMEPTSKRELVDPEADLDTLSYINARGEVYQEVPVNETAEVGGVRGNVEVTHDRTSNIYSLNFYLGKRYTSGGFLTEDGAKAAAERFGLDHRTFTLHQNDDAQWFIKTRQDVTETGIATPALTEQDFPELGLLPKASAMIRSADNIMPEMFNRSRFTATIGKSRLIAGVVKPYVDNLKFLSKKSIRNLAKVLERGETDQKWFSQAEFEYHFERASGRLPTKKETLAYYSVKDLSDINHHIFNNNLYADKARRGVITVSAKNDKLAFDTGRMNGRIIDNPDFTTMGRIFDLDEGTTKYASDAADLQEKFASGNYRVIDLETPYVRPGEDPVKTILAHNSSSTIGPLEREQLGYIAGGSRENRFKWFVKQANQREFRDGSTFWTNPITHIAAATRVDAAKWAESMEAARQAFISKTMTDTEKRLALDKSPVQTLDKFEQLVREGSINPNHPFEVLFDRQVPSAMNHMGDADVKWIDPEMSSAENYAISKGRMYYSKKGDRLKDPHEEQARILDPLTTVHNATQNAVQTAAFGDYHRQVIDEWSRLATPFVDRASVGRNFDPSNVFFNGTLKEAAIANPDLASKLEATRQTHMRLMNLRTPQQSQLYIAQRKLASWLETKGKWGEALSSRVLDKMSTNPVNAVRGMVFDIHLGFFEPSQLIVQTQTALMAMAANPVWGAKAAANIKPLLHMMMNRSESLLEHYAGSLPRDIMGITADDYKNMVRSLRNSGIMDVGGEMAQIDGYLNTIGGSMIARTGHQIQQTGRYFFNKAEQFNRLVAYTMAWQSVRHDLPELDGLSREFQTLVNKKADDYSINMTASSGAAWQKGILSVPTQFLAYQTRVLEAILPKWFPVLGNTRFTGMQKARMAISQLVLYGATGIPGGLEFMRWANKMYADNNGGDQLTPDIWRAMTKGFWDTAMFYGTGGAIDTDFARRAGQGAAWSDFYNKLTNGDLNNFLEVATGPSGAFLENIWNQVSPLGGRLWKYMAAEQSVMLTPEAWELVAADAFQQVSTFNRLHKAYWLWKTGTLVDPKSGEAIVSADRLNTAAVALGIPLRQETERWDIIRDKKERDQEVRDMGTMVASMRRNAIQAMMDGDAVKEQSYFNLSSALMMPYRDDPYMSNQIAQESFKQMGYDKQTEWDALSQKLFETTGREPMGGR